MAIRNPTRGQEDESYLASLSDLMVGLLFLFIIMLMAFALNFRAAEDEARAELDQLESGSEEIRAAKLALAAELQQVAAERDALRAQAQAVGSAAAALVASDAARADLLITLEGALHARGVSVNTDPANGILRLPEGLLFDSGEAELRTEGEAALRTVADALAEMLPCLSGSASDAACPAEQRPVLEAVLIEGHTDDQPVRSGAFGDNWQLSTARSISTFKALTGFRPELERLRNERGEALLGVSGYAERRPVAAGRSPDARRLNRRIDLRFIVAAPSRDQLEAVRSDLEAVVPRSEADGVRSEEKGTAP